MNQTVIQTRGIRNNNPGNIIRNEILWEGMAPDQSKDARFVVFSAPVWGIRALTKILISYNRQGLSTVDQIINRWAPRSENDTSAYIMAVSRALAVSPDDEIDFTSPAILFGVTSAIIRHENGCQPYPISVVTEAIKRAQSDSMPATSGAA